MVNSILSYYPVYFAIFLVLVAIWILISSIREEKKGTQKYKDATWNNNVLANLFKRKMRHRAAAGLILFPITILLLFFINPFLPKSGSPSYIFIRWVLYFCLSLLFIMALIIWVRKGIKYLFFGTSLSA